jgi:hypothetical protein
MVERLALRMAAVRAIPMVVTMAFLWAVAMAAYSVVSRAVVMVQM